MPTPFLYKWNLNNGILKGVTKDVIQNKLTALGVPGVVVALDKNGNRSFELRAGMYRSSMNQKGNLAVKIYKE